MTNIAKNIEKIMLESGLDKVKNYSNNNNNKFVVIQGNLDNTFTLTFKNEENDNDIEESEYYVVLKNRKLGRTITIWKQVSTHNFKSLIKSAKIYTGIDAPETKKMPHEKTVNSDNTKKPHRSSLIPITLTIGILLCSVTGIYLGNTIRNICFQSGIEQVEMQKNK